MSKGYFLDKWFSISEKIHNEMNLIFIQNNVPFLRLEMLPELELVRWKNLHAKSNRVSDKICKLITAK